MNINFKISLNIVVIMLVLVFSPITANAYISSGIDGVFQPTASMAVNSSQSVFDFTNIFIPSSVTVSFAGFTSTQPIELLATGNIDIAGTIDIGKNSLWIQTPGSISFSGSINGSGGTLSLVANTMNLSGAVNIQSGNVNLATNSEGGTITGGFITLGSGANLPIGGSGIISLSPVPEPGIWTMLFLGLLLLLSVARPNPAV